MKTDPHCSCWRKTQASLAPTSISKTFSARAGRLLQISPTDWFVLRLFAKASVLWIGHLFAICHANLKCPLLLQLIYTCMLLIWSLDPTSLFSKSQICFMWEEHIRTACFLLTYGAEQLIFLFRKIQTNSQRCSLQTGRWGKFFGQVSNMQHLTRRDNTNIFSYQQN